MCYPEHNNNELNQQTVVFKLNRIQFNIQYDEPLLLGFAILHSFSTTADLNVVRRSFVCVVELTFGLDARNECHERYTCECVSV